MDIEVGEYVRDRDGAIYKVNEIFLLHANVEIVKHSKNIIDLIEEGDYVNGVEVSALKGEKHLSEVADEEDVIYTTYNDNWGEWSGFKENEIKSIVTKEQYKSIEYKVEER